MEYSKNCRRRQNSRDQIRRFLNLTWRGNIFAKREKERFYYLLCDSAFTLTKLMNYIFEILYEGCNFSHCQENVCMCVYVWRKDVQHNTRVTLVCVRTMNETVEWIWFCIMQNALIQQTSSVCIHRGLLEQQWQVSQCFPDYHQQQSIKVMGNPLFSVSTRPSYHFSTRDTLVHYFQICKVRATNPCDLLWNKVIVLLWGSLSSCYW